MSKDEPDSTRARMFIALDLSRRVKEEITDWGREELADPALRLVPPENLHVTLAFLGDRPLSEVDPIAQAIEWWAEIPVLLELGGPVGRPRRGRAQLIALPVLGNPVPGRREDLVEALAYEGLYRPEKRPFWPHVTVARVRPEGHGSRRPQQVEVRSGPSPTARIGWFNAVRVSLYRSELQPQGAVYSPLAQVELPGAGWQ
jgi:RNA 2',3'-cyclic 3'-phosphodiesterase